MSPGVGAGTVVGAEEHPAPRTKQPGEKLPLHPPQKLCFFPRVLPVGGFVRPAYMQQAEALSGFLRLLCRRKLCKKVGVRLPGGHQLYPHGPHLQADH